MANLFETVAGRFKRLWVDTGVTDGGLSVYSTGVAISSGPNEGNTTTETILTVAAQTTTQNSPDENNEDAVGAYIYLDVTAGATLDLVLEVQIKDEINDDYYSVGVDTTGVVGTGNFAFYFGPVGPGAGVRENFVGRLPREWRVRVVHNNVNAATYTVSIAYTR
tara:strand:+ start:147 stop:638 length:492 start_codon:yes stop_codon:yes gene_type:complete